MLSATETRKEQILYLLSTLGPLNQTEIETILKAEPVDSKNPKKNNFGHDKNIGFALKSLLEEDKYLIPCKEPRHKIAKFEFSKNQIKGKVFFSKKTATTRFKFEPEKWIAKKLKENKFKKKDAIQISTTLNKLFFLKEHTGRTLVDKIYDRFIKYYEESLNLANKSTGKRPSKSIKKTAEQLAEYSQLAGHYTTIILPTEIPPVSNLLLETIEEALHLYLIEKQQPWRKSFIEKKEITNLARLHCKLKYKVSKIKELPKPDRLYELLYFSDNQSATKENFIQKYQEFVNWF